MSFTPPFLKRFVLPATILLLVVVCIFWRLTDTVVVDLTSGFSHPLEGWDHLVTMLAVGIWAAQLRGKAIWLLPLTFVSVMSLGGISGAAKYLAVPSAEILIVLSCLVFSVLILRKIRFDTKINVLIVAFFAFFHGYAHGAEISASASLISYTLGFIMATLLLHGVGILIAKMVLISVAFFIAQMLHFSPSESAKNTVTAYYSVIEHCEISVIEITILKLPLNFLPPDKLILQFFTPLKTYFVLSTLLLVFTVTKFICYVFYSKQRCNFVLFLARCFRKSLYLLTLPAFQSLHFNSHQSLFLGGNFRTPSFSKIIL
jgi:hydrogenase/urease accessory protein HupE